MERRGVMQNQKDSLLIFIPTYNERDNIHPLYQEIKKHVAHAHILFCDDNSPDGTGHLINDLIQQDETVKVIHRPGKLGTGTAYVQAFSYAQENKFEYLITMDADFTHHPSYIPELLSKRESADIIIGSRYAQGGTMIGWNNFRLPLTHFWRNMIWRGLGLSYDCTGAFRLYRVNQLKPATYTNFRSKGFSFCLESIYRLHQDGLKIDEVPIQAHSRKHGESKLSGAIMREVAFTLFKLSAEKRGFIKK